MNELITLHSQTIAGSTTETISARELHVFLESKQDFSTWVKARINDYGFQENVDFVKVKDPAPQKNGAEESKGYENWTVRVEYYITLDMAKELAMVERNEKGKQARQYFIECEKKLRGSQPQVVGELVAPSNNFNALYSVMRTIGLDNNAAAISANQAVLKVSGVNLLELTGQTHLLAERQERWYTPTQLGQMCSPTMPPKNFNLLLAAHNLQVRVGDSWVALEAGEEYSRLFDTGKRRGNGTPVLQLKWSSQVLDIVFPKKEN